MALDTRDERASAISVGLPWRGLLPLPDGAALDEGDRQQVATFYRGISSGGGGAAPASGGEYIIIFRRRRRAA